jgi:hypothetical protein
MGPGVGIAGAGRDALPPGLALIDQLMNETSHSVAARIVAERGAFLETSAYAVFNDLIGSLAPERRRLLSQMLEEERVNAVHDVLAALTWWISPQRLGSHFGANPCRWI